jgi:hypothetical protein
METLEKLLKISYSCEKTKEFRAGIVLVSLISISLRFVKNKEVFSGAIIS